MKYIDISNAKVGLVLAEDIFDNSGSLLAKSETVITEENLRMFQNAEIAILAVEEEATQEDPYAISDKDKDKVMNLIVGQVTNAKLLGKDYFASIKGIALETISEVLIEDPALYILNQVYNIDSYTINHSIRVALISALIADWQKLDNKMIEKALVAGLFSQVGKLDIPKDVLLKTEPLNEEELTLIKNYTSYSDKYLDILPFIDQEIRLAIMQSTERMDGTGLPNGLKNEQISHLARIVGVANIFDAAVNDKCYKEAISPFQIATELFEESIEHLSPKATMPLIKTIEKSFLGMKVELSNGEIGEVVFMNKLDSKRPLVKVGDTIYDLSMGKEKLTITKMFGSN